MTTRANSAIWSNQGGDLTSDRGLFYGDGLFETILLVNGGARLLDAHLARLTTSARRFGLTVPANLRTSIQNAIADSAVRDGVLKVLLSRRLQGRGYAATPGTESNLHLLVYPNASATRDRLTDQEDNAALITVARCTLKLAQQPALAGHKHLNRLEQVLARSEWQRTDIHEALMLDTQDNLIEATASNVFLAKNDTVLTPDLSACGVAGVMRGWVLAQAARLNLSVAVGALSLADVMDADEVFLTNALTGIRSVGRFIDQLPEDSVREGEALNPVRTFVETPIADRLRGALARVTEQTGR